MFICDFMIYDLRPDWPVLRNDEVDNVKYWSVSGFQTNAFLFIADIK